jgi:hypothetical protein
MTLDDRGAEAPVSEAIFGMFFDDHQAHPQSGRIMFASAQEGFLPIFRTQEDQAKHEA